MMPPDSAGPDLHLNNTPTGTLMQLVQTAASWSSSAAFLQPSLALRINGAAARL